MSAVERRVVELLRTLRDVQESYDAGSGGDGVSLMPSAYHEGSYAELQRVLRLLRDSPAERRFWWHVCARYVWVSQRRTRVPVVRTRQGPVPLPPPGSEVEIVISVDGRKALVRLAEWPLEVDARLVALGVARVARLMYGGDHGRVVVPRELRGRLEVPA